MSAAALLAEKSAAGATGIITAEKGKHKRLICLDKGFVTYVISNVIEEQFDETLVEQDLIAASARAKAKAMATKESKKLTAYLLEKEIMKPSELRLAMESHVKQLVFSTLEWSEGEYSFAAGKPDLGDELVVRLPCAGLMLEHAASYPAAIDDVRVRIGPPNIRPKLTKRSGRLLKGLELDGAAGYLIERCDGSVELSELLSSSDLPDDDLLRAAYGLIQAGVVQAGEDDTPKSAKPQDQAGRAECLARLERAEGADHYSVLGVGSSASAAEVRQAYYLLARRFHPDRFRVGELQDLLSRIEDFFAKVTEAYNTLIDPELRTGYDAELAEQAGAKKKEPAQDTRHLARQNFARAKVLLEKKRFQDAVTFLENAVELDENNVRYHMELGRVLLLNPRRRQDCESHLRRAMEIDPTMTEIHFALAELYAKTGRAAQARAALNEVLRWEPGNAEAKKQLKLIGRG
jgi:curved DNA-binding protein CbpA